jgi:uncharacterized membrane protein YjjP (DUF1212 family)
MKAKMKSDFALMNGGGIRDGLKTIVSLIIGFTFSSYLLNMPAAAGSGLILL